MVTLAQVIKHCRDREYMSGVARDTMRVKLTGEVFTPTPLVQEVLDRVDPAMFVNPDRTFIDQACGDGQFLSEVLIRKMQNGSTFEQALSTIYGVDIMQDNVDQCRDRLLCGQNHLRHIVEQNIYQADSTKFSHEFHPMSDTRRKREDALRRKEARERQKRLKAEQERRRLEERARTEKKLFGAPL